MHYRLGFLSTLLLAVLGWTTAVIAEPTSGSRPLNLTVVEDNFFDFQLQKSAKNADNAAVEVTQGPEDPKTESEQEAAKESTGIFAPTADNLVIGSGQSGQPGVIFGFGSLIAEPTTLNGLTRTTGPVPAQNQVLTLSPVELYTGFNFSEKNRLLLEIQADPQAASGDLSYTFSPESIAGAFSLNVFTQRAFAGVFVGGNRDVELSDNRTPWLHRTGAGFEYTQAVNDSLDIAAGANYQRVTVRDGAFSQNIFAEDEFGNAVTVSKDGKDDLVTLSFAGVLSNLDNRGFPTRGNRVRFGTDVSLPITNTDIFFSRVSGGIVQYVPVDLFGFGSGERTLVFSAQGGYIFGDVPPYEAFSMGGFQTIRGYSGGDVGSGRAFLLGFAEYRFPISQFQISKFPVKLRGNLFFDAGSDLGTSADVIGEPGIARDKDATGFGYGLGLDAQVPGVALFRLSFGFNNVGEFRLLFRTGDRF